MLERIHTDSAKQPKIPKNKCEIPSKLFLFDMIKLDGGGGGDGTCAISVHPFH